MNMHLRIFILLYLTTSMVALSENGLLQKPVLSTPEEVEQIVADWQTSFTWRLGWFRFTCAYERAQTSVMLACGGMPLRSSNFPYYAALAQLFKKSPERELGRSYYYAKPRQTKGLSHTSISLNDAIEFLKDKKFIIYTGAGISAASKVMTMHELELSLGLKRGMAHFLKHIFLYPDRIQKAFGDFCATMLQAPPTAAHYAVHTLAQRREIAILTDNADLLHQRAGSHPMRTHSPEATAAITAENMAEIDVIVCAGFSHDDCGLLAYFKQHNPQGIIMAIDIGKPKYLGNDDYLLQQDVQIALPAMAECL